MSLALLTVSVDARDKSVVLGVWLIGWRMGWTVARRVPKWNTQKANDTAMCRF